MEEKSWTSRYTSILLLQGGLAVGWVDQGIDCKTKCVQLLLDCPKRAVKAAGL